MLQSLSYTSLACPSTYLSCCEFCMPQFGGRLHVVGTSLDDALNIPHMSVQSTRHLTAHPLNSSECQTDLFPSGVRILKENRWNLVTGESTFKRLYNAGSSWGYLGVIRAHTNSRRLLNSTFTDYFSTIEKI
jgi:hypothetical protein